MDTPAIKAPLPFQPSPLQLLRLPMFERNETPRYLFRTYSPKSAGKTSLTAIIPPASTSGRTEQTRDIFKLDQQDAAARLNAHLRWWPSHERDCNLMSWTSSLLFALQYGLFKHRSSKDSSELSQIFLLILDTREFPNGTFIKDMEIMEVFANPDNTQRGNLDDFLNLRKSSRGYYFGEYLSQGELSIQGKCVETTMQRMIDVGLFELYPELGDKSQWNLWADRVISLRQHFQSSQDAPPATHIEVRKAISIAEACFGNCWVVPVAAMLLALKHRHDNDPVIVDGFAAMFAGKCCEFSYIFSSTNSF